MIQAQTELERVFNYYNLSYELAKPSKKWKEKEQIKEFNTVMNYTNRTNADSRSACFFAYELFKIEERKIKFNIK